MLKEDLDLAWGVEFTFVVGEGSTVFVGLVHGLDKSVAVDEGKQSHTHLLIASTVYVNVEVVRVEIDDL